MNLKEALKILNLNKNCTEEELKISYRNLIRKYHPDLCTDETKKNKYEEISKKINEANRVIKEYLKNNNKINSNNDIENYKINILEYLKEELEYIETIDWLNIPLYQYKGWFTKIINNYLILISNVKTKEELTYFYKNYKEEYFGLMCCYNYVHWTKTKIIDFVNGNIKITRETTLKELQTKKLEIINNIFILELNKYKNIDDYLKLEPLLLKIKNNYNLICLYGNSNIDNLKTYFNKVINEEINKYYERKKLLDELIEYDGTILPHSIELYNNILDDEAFYNLYNKIEKPSIIKKWTKTIKKHLKVK